jgi:hypothetical protein
MVGRSKTPMAVFESDIALETVSEALSSGPWY